MLFLRQFRSLKRRPARKGMLIVEKYSGPTTRTWPRKIHQR